VTQDELAALRRDNRLTTVMPKAMAGQVTDYTQKPILMLREDKKEMLMSRRRSSRRTIR
jgi:hypothetical protein